MKATGVDVDLSAAKGLVVEPVCGPLMMSARALND
jgi:hypothetical protein